MKLIHAFAITALGLFSLTSCDKDSNTVTPLNYANVSVTHASPNAPGVDLLINDQKVNTSALLYPNTTGYLQVEAKSNNIKVNVSGTTTSVINAA